MSFVPVIVVTLAGVVAATVQQIRLGISERHRVVLEDDLHQAEAEIEEAKKAKADAEAALKRTDTLLADVRRRYETVIAAKNERIADAQEALSQCLAPGLVAERLQGAFAVSADDHAAEAGQPRLRAVTATGGAGGEGGEDS